MAVQDEDEFVYHARQPARQVDPAIRRMVLGAGGVSVLVIGVAMLWSGIRGPVFGPPPVISPPPGPIRVAPADPGGLVVPEANVQIMSGDDSAPAPAQLAPAGPAPDISQLDAAAGLPVPGAPPPVTAPAPAAAPAEPPGPAQVQLAATADETGAEAVWQGLQEKLPKFFAGKTPEILPVVVDGQSVWRLRLGGFSSATDAKTFCAEVAAQGAACTVAAF